MTVAQLTAQAAIQPIRVRGRLSEGFDRILTPEALQFVAELERRFGKRRQQLLGLRVDRQRRLNSGELPGFKVETAELRAAKWRVKKAPSDLQDRRVEITGPVDRKGVIDALNSGANGFVADFEDAHTPNWSNTIEGQINLFDAIHNTLSGPSPEDRPYQLTEQPATLMICPRGWHREEQHLEVDHQAVSASLFDFGLFIFHNAPTLLEKGSAPYFYLPKLEGYIEAQLWADVFAYAEESLGINHGSICCTVLIETIPAAFEMEEILYTLRDYAVGLNSGRRNYLFSFIKRLHANPEWVLPECSRVSRESGFFQALVHLLIQTCHRRGAHAIGGRATQIPIKDDPSADAKARQALSADTAREATEGYDGTWVAHPDLVPVAKAAFDQIMPGVNQIDRPLSDLAVTESDLLEIPASQVSEAGLSHTIRAGLHYLAAGLEGRGAAPVDNLRVDAATAELARAQIWQWIRSPKGMLEDGRDITFGLFNEGVVKELEQIRQQVGQAAFEVGHYQAAATLFREIIAKDRFIEFLILPAYPGRA